MDEFIKKVFETKPIQKIWKSVEKVVIPGVILFLILYITYLSMKIDILKETMDSKNQRIGDLESRVEWLNKDLEIERNKSEDCRKRYEELESKLKEVEKTLSRREQNDNLLGGLTPGNDTISPNTNKITVSKQASNFFDKRGKVVGR